VVVHRTLREAKAVYPSDWMRKLCYNAMRTTWCMRTRPNWWIIFYL